MSSLFEAAYPFADDVLALPVRDLDETVAWYQHSFGLSEVERTNEPVPRVIMERDGVQIGFAINGGDASQDGAAIKVTDILRVREEIESNGVETGNWRVDERNGQKLQVFFVVAPMASAITSINRLILIEKSHLTTSERQ